MASTNNPEGVLCISTTWDETTGKVISNFCKSTLDKTSNELSEVHCTVLNVEISEETKNEAARYGVTLIPASRNKLIDPLEDPPGIHWLINHNNYYPGLREKTVIGHVVWLSEKTKNAAYIIQRSLFPEAKLHRMPSKAAAVFVAHVWNKDGLGLTGFHRTLVQDFCERKSMAGEDVIAYSTVVDVKISDDQKKDAQSCRVTLIPAQRREGIVEKQDPPRPEWLLHHESYYPNLGKIENVQYVIGYAPKTGHAAAYIREKLFPNAKLVLINHACPETNCLQAEEHGMIEFEEEMLHMASKADLLFSIGPRIHQYFENAYQKEIKGKDLIDIPHAEILPSPMSCTLHEKASKGEIREYHILTCGQMDTRKAIDKCHTMAASIGEVANHRKARNENPPAWKIQGVSQQADNKTVKSLSVKMKSPHIVPKLHPGHSAKALLGSLQQSHLCLPLPSYVDYSFYGMEAVVSGLPTAVDECSHLAHFITEYFKEHAEHVVIPQLDKYTCTSTKAVVTHRILQHLQKSADSFTQAKALKTVLVQSKVIEASYEKFTSLLTSTVQQQMSNESEGHGMERNEQDSLTVQIGLDDSVLQQHPRESEGESKERPAQISRDQAEKIMAKLKDTLKRKVDELVADEDSCKAAKKICKKILDEVDPQSLVAESLGILIRFLTLYTLHKMKHTCRSGRLAKAFEPLLITDEMRQIAEKVGIKLQLKATYDTEKFNKVELFFIHRDGGGIQPAKFFDDVVEEENLEDGISFGRDDSVLKEDSEVTESGHTDIDQKDPGQSREDPSKLLLLELDGECEIRSSTETNVCSLFKAEKCIRWTGRQFDVLQAVMIMTDRVEHILSFRQEILALLGVTRYLLADSEGLPFLELEEQLIQHGEPTQPITAVYETLSLQARSLLPHKPSKKNLTDSEIRYLELAQSKVHSLQNQLDKAFTEKKLLETQLAEAVLEKSEQERQCQEYMQRCHTAEKVVSTRLSDMHKFKDRVEMLEIKLKEKDTIITELRTRLSQLSDTQSDTELPKKIAESLQLGGNVSKEMEQKAKTKIVASAVHENLFPEAKLNLVNSKPATLFVGIFWNEDELGLTGFHRTLIKDFCERKAKVGEDLKAYSTVIDVIISDDQKKDAESCGVTLIAVESREGIKPQYDRPRPEWLLAHESYYRNLGEIENVHYVVGYEPKTGLAAADIRDKLFPGAKLVLINHACPESNCLQAEEYGLFNMLHMASRADLLFSVGPYIHQYFQNAYRAEFNGKMLSEIPHEEILPIPISCTLRKEAEEGKITQHHILTCGQLDVQDAIERCDVMAASIGQVVNHLKASYVQTNHPVWKIQGVSQQEAKKVVTFLSDKMQCQPIKPILQPGHSAKHLVRSLQQSHLCVPSPCYIDYSFYGMEAMVSGLPTVVDEDSHLAHFITKHFKEHTAKCIVSAQTAENNLTSRILKHIQDAPLAFKQAKALKTDLEESGVIETSHARFTTLLTSATKQQTDDESKNDGLERDVKDSLAVLIGLDYMYLREVEQEFQAFPAQVSREQVNELITKLKATLKRQVEEKVADEDMLQEMKKLCKKVLGDVVPKSWTAESSAILLRFLTLYNLYRLKQTCRSGSLAKAFEPLLITDEMRKIASHVGVQLKLRAMYNEEQFKEVELFFINRDGGGI